MVDDHEKRIIRLEVIQENINNNLSAIAKRFDKIDERFNKIDERFDKVDAKIESNFKWLLAMLIGGFTSILGVLAHSLHWI